MPVKHAGTGVPHHGLSLLLHNGPVTMHRALGARRFILLERTFAETPLVLAQIDKGDRAEYNKFVCKEFAPSRSSGKQELNGPGMARQTLTFGLTVRR